MKKIKKISYIFIVFIIFSMVGIFGSFVSADTTAYDIDEYIIDAKVLKNGDLYVVEKIAFDFNESANGIYRDILYKYSFKTQKDDMSPTSSRYQASDVIGIKVSETNIAYDETVEYNLIDEESAFNGNNNLISIQQMKNDGYVKRIKIYTPSTGDDKKYFKIEYVLKDVASLYNDKGEIYWNFVGKNWDCYIKDLKINISFEGSSLEPIKVYPHSYADIENITNLNEKISFELPTLSPGIAVDARVVFASDYLDRGSISKVVNEDYDFNILEEIEKGMQFGKKRYDFTGKVTAVVICLTIIYFIILFRESGKISKKGKNKEHQYYRETLDNIELSKCVKILGGVINNPVLLIATILDLKQKKIIEMNSQKKLKKSFDGIEYDYYLTINENADFEKLSKYEKLILNYLFNDNTKEEISGFKDTKIELNDRLKQLGKSYSKTSSFNIKCKGIDEDMTEEVFEKPDRTLKKFSLWSLLIISFIELFTIFVISPLDFSGKMYNFAIFFVIFSIIILFAVIFTYVRSLKEKHYKDYNNLKGLEKYLKDYSLIKDRYPIEIELWEKYLVFATLFGIAKKVSKEFKEELLAKGYDEEYIDSTYPTLGMTMYSSQLTTNAAASTGSSSSGGYSGSGSGGGGGGGGGGGSF